VHRLVASAFLGESDLLVLHKDGDNLNNNIGNLYYGTHSDNYKDSKRHGTASFGERHGQHKLTADNVKNIRELLKTKLSASEIGKMFGVQKSTVLHIKWGKTWKEYD
jgi:hypothetical protein